MPNFVVTVHSDDRETIIHALRQVEWGLDRIRELPIPCFKSFPRIDEPGRVEDDYGRLLGSFGLEASRGE